MRKANIISGSILSLFGLTMLVFVIPWQIEAGPEGVLPPSLVPNLTMIVVTALSVLLVVNNLRAGPDMGPPPITRSDIAALLKIGAIFVVTVLLYLWVSPLAAGAALMVITLLVLGERRLIWLVTLPSALLLAIWFLFYKVLGTAIV